jgi:hypothetical protein
VAWHCFSVWVWRGSSSQASDSPYIIPIWRWHHQDNILSEVAGY